MANWLTRTADTARPPRGHLPRRCCWMALVCFACRCLGAVGCSTAGQAIQPATEATIHLNVNLIQLSASVVDPAGKLVPGLDRTDFKLFIDGKPQPIISFERDDAPVAAGILVDNSASMNPKSAEVIAAALAFARASKPIDQMFVVHFSGQARLGLPPSQPFTSDVSQLEAGLLTFNAEGTTALYDAVLLAISHCRLTTLDRKVLLIISDGGDNSSQASLEDALKLAEKSGIVIYSVGIYDNGDQDRNPQVLAKFAGLTGGKAFFPKELRDATSTCVTIARDIRQQYTLGFEGAEDGDYHRIQINASHPNFPSLKVLTRAGYLAPNP